MREAKQKFDDLVSKIKSGSDVSFGVKYLRFGEE